MNNPTSLFDRVYVINLPNRLDRMRALLARLDKYGWPFRMPEVYRAIDGDIVGVPNEFTQGGGAYGCRMSHLRILQDCLMDGVRSVLILEDDADIIEGFAEHAIHFMQHVPGDWEGIMFGGQHHAPPIKTDADGVVRVRYAQRTHAYAARPAYMKSLQQRWGNGTVHIDWMMENWQHHHVVYAPDPWLIGQAGGRSDIRGAEKPTEWWVSSSSVATGPVALASVDRSTMEEMIEFGFHPGMNRDESGIDVGLKQVFADGVNESDTAERLRRWIEMIQSESVGGLLPTVWHPKATVALVRAAWSGDVLEVRGDTAREAFDRLPYDVRRKMQERASLRTNPIVLLRCPKEMICHLRGHGFHAGYWRDNATGLDNGLIRILRDTPESERVPELRKWCDYLCREADRDGLIVAAIHPDLTVDMLRDATARGVREIEENNIDKLKDAITGATP